MKLAILVTGGTFDKRYDEIAGVLDFGRTNVGEMLKLARCRLSIRTEVVMMKDSLQMTDADRARIAATCARCRERRIVITHGTDTMEHTARYLGARITDRTIVLTGAMVPYTFGSSDGLFNLGSALAFAQQLPAGVYIAMNGRVFPHDRVRKDRKRGIFVESAAAPLSRAAT
jgi:L-asparaginase